MDVNPCLRAAGLDCPGTWAPSAVLSIWDNTFNSFSFFLTGRRGPAGRKKRDVGNSCPRDLLGGPRLASQGQLPLCVPPTASSLLSRPWRSMGIALGIRPKAQLFPGCSAAVCVWRRKCGGLSLAVLAFVTWPQAVAPEPRFLSSLLKLI
jgi:hypothetical protein